MNITPGIEQMPKRSSELTLQEQQLKDTRKKRLYLKILEITPVVILKL